MKSQERTEKGPGNSEDLEGTWPASELLARLEGLDAQGKSLQAKKTRMWRLLAGSFVVAVVFEILRSVLAHKGIGYYIGIVSPYLIFGGILGIILSLVMLFLLRSRKYDKDAVTVLMPLVRCIAPDLAKGSGLKVRASFKPPTHAAFRVGDEKKYTSGKNKKCFDRFFQREIFTVECHLGDGTRLQAGMTEHTLEKEAQRKNSRGKLKIKKKLRRKIRTRVRFLLNEARCRLTGTIKVPAGAEIRVRQHPRGTLISLAMRQELTSTQPLDAGPLLSLLSGSYAAVTTTQPTQRNPAGERP
jgi:hypothetical protein